MARMTPPARVICRIVLVGWIHQCCFSFVPVSIVRHSRNRHSRHEKSLLFRGLRTMKDELHLMPSTTDKAMSDDLERYRERARLAESVLKGKLEDLALDHAKLEVIQDVIQKMKVKVNDGVSKWQQKCDALREERDEARHKFQFVTAELKNRKNRWASQRQQYKTQLQQLMEKVGQETNLAREYQRKYKEGASQLQQMIETGKEEKAATTNEMEALRRDIAKLTDQLNMEGTLREEALRQEREKTAETEAELSSVKEELDRAKLEVNERMNEEDEAIEIAKSSVAAAERREAETKAKYESLLLKFEREANETKTLRDQLDGERESFNAPEVAKLKKEIEDLNEQIRSLKMAHGAEVRAERRTAEARVSEVAEKYQRQMQRIRSAALSGSLGQSDQSQNEAGGVWKRIRRPFRRQRP